MSMLIYILLFAAIAIAPALVASETHTVEFINRCSSGVPRLKSGGAQLNADDQSMYTSNGPINSAILYLDHGFCEANGENCTLLELNLANGGNGATSVDISLITPHVFSDAVAFEFVGGSSFPDGQSCDGQGASCGDPNCKTAFEQPNDTCVQVGCNGNDVGLIVYFCEYGTFFTNPNQTGRPCST